MIIKTMDLTSLMVFNELNKLNITELEFADIEQELKQDSHTGIYIACVKNGYCICINHNNNKSIVIKAIKIKNKVTNEITIPQAQTRVLLKTYITIKDLPDEYYVLHNIGKDTRDESEIKGIANTLDEIKESFIKRFSINKRIEGFYLGSIFDSDIDRTYDNEKKDKLIIKKSELITNEMKAIFYLFNAKYDNLDKNINFNNYNVPRIIKVFEYKNYRLTILCELRNRKVYVNTNFGHNEKFLDNINFKIQSFNPNHLIYNYIDENRDIYYPNKYDETAIIVISDEMKEKLNIGELQTISKYSADEIIYLSADTYNQLDTKIQRILIAEKNADIMDKAKSNLEDKYYDQYKNKKRLVKNDFVLTDTKICYGTNYFENHKIFDYVLDKNIYEMKDLDFNILYNNFIEYVLKWNLKNYHTDSHYSDFKGTENIVYNNINIKLEKRDKLFYINDIKIAFDDVTQALKDVLKFSTIEEYNLYLKEVSRVNFKTKKVLDKGYIEFTINIKETDDNPFITDNNKMLLGLKVIREKNKNYILINKDKYPISDFNNFLMLAERTDKTNYRERQGDLQRAINILYKSIKGLTPKTIADLITKGIAYHKLMLEKIEQENKLKLVKATEFLNNAIKSTNAIITEKGYLVTSRYSQLTYLILFDKKVYLCEYENNVYVPKEYICIIDNDYSFNEQEWKIKDKIANRLFLCSNDVKVADEVYTIKNILDKHNVYKENSSYIVSNED